MFEDKSSSEPKCSHEELRRRLDFSDQQLLADCTVNHYKASGPGGQHRNKVTSAIRLNHLPSGIQVTATESRSQHENKARALRRLREAIALAARVPLTGPLRWPENVHIKDGRLRVNEKNPSIHQVIALVLDALEEHGGQLKDAARSLELTTSGLSKFLYEHAKAWREAKYIRQRAGLPPLRPPK